ncbi:hypothetical protein [Bdellovibrio svalbardensis]|uniref:Uncharacterized protein n=1 Tax=Bdellovibrio svalbardensis TaxID=2972972 RepID=A0ABT6DHZ9_9BACT|nr:hypothetical protein [Bdellovibrio svalbardensis]MDG0816487.1 hypothetical protein [Bdellovibrio svalbardensis]
MGIIIFLISISFARESLFRATPRTEVSVPSARGNEVAQKPVPKQPPRKAVSTSVRGNLDKEILVISKYKVEDSAEITPKERVGLKFKGLRVGEVLSAEITEEVTVYPDSKTPVRATVSSGKLKGAILVGEATLEKNSKKVLINFKQIRQNKGEDLYQLAGYSLIEGEYHSNEKKFFIAEFLSAAAAGIADASINRSQNVLGNYVEEPSLDTTGKKALGAALNKSAERLAEKQRSAPEFTVVGEVTGISILITDQPSTL